MNIKNDAKIYEFLKSEKYRIQPNGVIEKVAYFRDLKLGKGVTKPVWKPVGFMQPAGPKLLRFEGCNLMIKRIIWIHYFGTLKKDQSVIVFDGNEGNCHPENLRLTTTTEVRLKCYRAGRKASAKLTWNEAQNLRNEWNTGKYTQKKLSEKYGVSQFGVSLIVRGKTYKNQINHETTEPQPADLVGVDVTDESITLSPGINNKDKGAA